MSNKTPTTTEQTPTPYIAVAANYYGTGKSAQEARKNLVKAGGSPQEQQTVFKLPEGATNAYVADNGNVYWYGVEGEMRPVFRYVNGKAVAWGQGEDKPVPYSKPAGKPKHSPQAQEQGEATPEPAIEATDKESTIASTDLPAKAKKPPRKPAKEPEIAAESAQEPADTVVETPAPKAKKPAKKPAPVTEGEQTAAAEEPKPTHATKLKQMDAERAAAGVEPVTDAVPAPKAKKAKTEPKKAEQTATTAGEAADFLMFVGGAHYTKEVFIEEAAKLGISRRMPSHRLPKGLVCGTSKVYLATEGTRKTDGAPTAEVFGYFVPSQVQFIANGKHKEFADIIGALKLRKDSKIIDSVKGEAERACGFRQEGGTYLVVDNADSPLKLLAKPAHYVGNHFRGTLRLNDLQARQFNTGGTVTTLVDEKCMQCGDPMKCAPDGHARAERERKRIEKGEAPKWLLLDAKCQKAVRAARAADDGPQASDEDQGEPAEATE